MTILKSALVLGSSGLVGKALVTRLLNDPRYSKVTCLVRRPIAESTFDDPQGKLQPLVINFEQLQEYQGYFSVDHVFCCLGTTLKQAGSKQAFRRVDFEYVHIAAQLARAQRVEGFVWISSIGANAKSRSFYLRVKGELENAIMRMSQLNYAAAVRPSLLLGQRNDSRPAETVGQWLAPLLSLVLKGPLKKYQPVTPEQVASEMLRLQVF